MLSTHLVLLLEVFAFVWGAVWGSFLNVVIHRLPLEMSVVRPSSHCGACAAPIRWYDNIPVISYLVLRGKCRLCAAPYSPRYMLVELACGVMSLVIFRAVANPFAEQVDLWFFFHWIWCLSFVLALVAITFIDLEHLYIPDVISLPLIMTGLLGSWISPSMDPALHLWGALGGAGFLLLVWGIGWLVFRREAMGLGDVKLLGLIGAFLGWKALPFVLFASSIQAVLAVVLSQIYARITGAEAKLTRTTEEVDRHFGEEERYADEELPSRLAIPYGPFLSLAALEALFFGHDHLWVLAEYLAQLFLPSN